MTNPLTWDYLTTVPETNEVFGPLAVAFLVVFGIGFVVAVFLYNDGAKRYIGHPVKRRAIRRGAGIATAVFGGGLFFFGIRVLQINPFTFGMRLWLWLSLLAALVMTAYFVYYARIVYPAQLRAYEARQRKQQYLKPAAGTGRRAATRAAGTRPQPATGRQSRRR